MIKRNNRYWRLLFLLVSLVVISLGFNKYTLEARSKKTELNPEHQEFYHYAQYLFTKDEKKLFHSLTTDEARERFIEFFWEIRDPTPYTEENEFKSQMETRYEYVCKYLKEGLYPGWKTDRGSIFLVLGPPTAHQEDHLNQGGVIQWYYAEYDVYIRFNDYRGDGIYHLDLNTVSLSILDVLDNKNHYIVDKAGKIKMETLDVDLNYDSKSRELLVKIASKNLNYEKASEDSDEMKAQIKVDLVVYPINKADDLSKYSEIKNIKVAKEKLLEKNAAITLGIPLKLPKGKIKIDVLITDVLGGAAFRKYISVKVK
jgi:GWxTD domain-containing protein